MGGRLSSSPAIWDGCVGWKARHMTALGTSTTAAGCRGFRPRRSRFQAHTKDFSVLQSPSSSLHTHMPELFCPKARDFIPTHPIPTSPLATHKLAYVAITLHLVSEWHRLFHAPQGNVLLWKMVPGNQRRVHTMVGWGNPHTSGNSSWRRQGRPRAHCPVLASGHPESWV